MRTTLTIDDRLFAELKERAHREGVPLKQVVNQALRRGLEAPVGSSKRKPYRVRAHSMGRALVPSLDKSLAIAAALEDDEIARKLAVRK
jgi:hypothetical protein